MQTRRTIVFGAMGGLALLVAGQAWAQAVPAGYPADYADLIAKAKKEGRLSVYTSTDSNQGQTLANAFKVAYPGLEIDWNDLGTQGAYNRVISEAAAGQVGCDVIWTSAMDLHLIMLNKGLTDS